MPVPLLLLGRSCIEKCSKCCDLVIFITGYIIAFERRIVNIFAENLPFS